MNLLDHKKNVNIKRPVRLWQFLLLLTVPIIFLAVVFVWSPRIQKKFQAETPEQPTAWSRVKNFVTVVGDSLRIDQPDRINILLLGKGGANHEGPDLTDTLIVLSVKPKSGETALLSIPRDLYVDLGKWGWRKINNAYALKETENKDSGGKFVSYIVDKHFRMPIHYYIVIDFDGFKDLIDDLGGVRVFVERAFVDNNFPADNFKTRVVSFEAGWQTMNGEKALQFARSRHGTNGETTDFARARRQQKIILAVKSKILSKEVLVNPNKLVDIITTLKKFVSTNIKVSEIWRLSRTLSKFNFDNTKTVVLDDAPNGFLVATSSPDGAYILLPKNNDWEVLRDVAKNIFRPNALSVQQ